MKQIKVRTCGNCPYNSIHYSSTQMGEWVDYCQMIGKIVNPNIIDEDCRLEDLKPDEN